MRHFILTLLLPLFMLQAPALAQSNSENQAQQAQTPSPTSSSLSTLVPLRESEQIQLRLVNCSWGLDCILADLLLPGAQVKPLELHFDNPTQTAIEVRNTAIVTRGALTWYQPSSDEIAFAPNPKPFSANQIGSLTLNFKPLTLPPDQYNGAAYLTLSGQPTRLTLPINMSVRSGPLMPLFVLFLGIILGRLLKYMETRGEAQANALRSINRLQSDIATVEPEDQAILTGMVKKTRKLVFREQLEDAEANVKVVRNRLEVLIRLRQIESSLELPAEETEQAITLIQKARNYLAQEDDARCKEALDKIIAITDSFSPRGAGEPEINETIRGAAANLEDNLRRPAIVLAQPNRIEWLQQFLIALSGLSEQFRAEATFWVVRPLLSLILLIGLSIVGINTLYVENGATFGAKPLSDYLGLILWGLSADVASRSLSSLRGQGN
jgi:hypothetical protein